MELIAPVLEIVKLAWGPIGRRIGYIKNLKKKMEELEKKEKDLFAKRDDVKEKIDGSIAKVATRVCNQWLEDVDLLEGKVKVVREKWEEDKKCLAGWCPNVYSSMKLGKCVEDIIKEIIDLNIRCSTIEGKELCDAPPDKIEPQFVQNLEVRSSTAAERTLEKILAYVKDDRIERIGIWGMGGVGKTTTMKLLNDQPEISLKYDIVIWVTVSKEGNRRTVQNVIAERLKLSATNVSDDRLRAMICQNLGRKKFLLLLDDVWEMIDLLDVGIPTLNQGNGCKVVMTTRSLNICRKMVTDEEIKVETLSKDEAWKLFNEKVGVVAMSPHIEPIARDIVEECDGLPLAIIVVGSSLRKNSDVVVWRNTLRQLQLPIACQIEDMEERVFRCLRTSYDQLQDDCKKKLFLYCSLYPEDYWILIPELVEYCWLEGYILGVDSIEEARETGYCKVMDLIDAALLEGYHGVRYVKMHDVVRDFALREGDNHGFFVKAGVELEHPPNEKKWLQLKKMSLMRSGLCSLLERPNCNIMSTLLLRDNYKLAMIPDSFFEFMHSLSILNLSGSKIQFLPSSLWNLVNLRGLYLKDCNKLEDLPSQIRMLMRLEVLHLGGYTKIKYLPREIGELTSLKRLIVGFKCREYIEEWNDEDSEERNDEDIEERNDENINDEDIEERNDENIEEWNMKLRIPTGIITNLQLLEELSLCVKDCFEKGQWDDESMEAVVDELCRMENLTYLDFYFPKEECLEHFLRKRKSCRASWFKRFRFRIGAERGFSVYSSPTSEAWEGCLVYKGGDEMSHVTTIVETLAHCSTFHLHDHCTAQKLSEFGMANMNDLKDCTIYGCDKMETLFDGDDEQETRALLPNLKKLEIWSLPEWRRLWVGPLLPGSLSKLTILKLILCDNLKKAFQLGIIRQLPSLKVLDAFGCSSLEEIIGIEEEMSVPDHAHITNNDTVILPNIKYIHLSGLPELVSICPSVPSEWPSLETIHIFRCPKFRSLSFLTHGTNNVAPALKKIEGESEWWEALEWEDNDIKQRLQPMFHERKW